MSDSLLEENVFFNYLTKNKRDQLCRWVEPDWILCIPHKFKEDIKLISIISASQALYRDRSNKSCYHSELCGESVSYEITGDDRRTIIWQEEKNNEVIISQAVIINEYLTPFEEHVVHVLLIDRLLPSMIEDDHLYLSQSEPVTISSYRIAELFLRSFKCHYPVLEKLENELQIAKTDFLTSGDVDIIQDFLHGVILQKWEILIKCHLPQLQTDSVFQDLIFRALDFFIVGFCHNELWNQVTERCEVVEHMVSTRIKYFRSCDISPTQLGLPKDYCTPLPAAVVEMATLNARVGALDRLYCIQHSFELIEAQTKEANALVSQFKDSDTNQNRLTLTHDDLISLMIIVVVQAQCFSLVANIYYMTHYVFSVSDDNDILWRGLSLLRGCLERIMKMDLSCLPPVNHPVRKELSLQDLMQVSSDVESRFETQYKEGSQSVSDITALDLQLHQLTQRIHKSTQALSGATMSERNSPSRRSDRMTSTSALTQNQSKIQSFLEFLSSIPSTIRASFRRRQSEQRTAFSSSVHS